MKTLIVFYSRNGTTKKIAMLIAKELKADIEEIKDTKNRLGFFGYIIAGKDAKQKKFTKLEKTVKDPSKYDLVIIGTPIWAWTVTPPVRTYLYDKKRKIKKSAFFCTQGGNGAENAFIEMEKITEKKPVMTLTLTTKEVVKEEYVDKLKKFLDKIKKLR